VFSKVPDSFAQNIGLNYALQDELPKVIMAIEITELV